MSTTHHARDWLLLLGTNLSVLDPQQEGRAAPEKALQDWFRTAQSIISLPPGPNVPVPPMRGRDPDWIQVRLSRRPLLAKRLGELAKEGIHVVTMAEKNYPRRLSHVLGEDAPPILFYAGDIRLADAPRIVGFAGSRDASGPSLEATAEMARSCADARIVVCSGGARGVDQEAEDAALGAGGSMVLCPPLGLHHVLRQRRFRQAVADGKMLCISAVDPNSGWHVGHAMARNDLIYAMSTLVCVMHAAKQSGGTWEGSTTALRRGQTLVATWKGAGHGAANATLEDMGAKPFASARILEVIAQLRALQKTQRVPPSTSPPKVGASRKSLGKEKRLFDF